MLMTLASSYDEVPYSSYPFSQSHPDRLATIAALFGMAAAPVDRCRVLELGCSSGGNLIPIAVQFPESQFVGVDFSRVELDQASSLVSALNLKNVELLHRNILELNADLRPFDYIIAHGVYSWVPDVVQDRILSLCSELLAPMGVAYISYNTYPGWHMRGMIRDMMSYRTAGLQRPEDRVRQGRGLLDFLAQSVPSKESAYGMLLSDELEQMRSKEDYYLLHEYLEEINTPIYFHQFIERATAKGLQYLGEADFQVMASSNFPPQVENTLHSVARDLIEMEQYMDFLRNRMFRQTILCRKEVRLDRSLTPERMQGLYVATSSRPEVPQPSLVSREPPKFRRPKSTMTTNEPLVKAAMMHLGDVWPLPMHFTELLAIARSRLNPDPIVVDTSRITHDARRLAEPLLRCYGTTHVDLSRTAPQFTTRVGRCPAVSPLARLQADTGTGATNYRHEHVSLNDLERQLMRFLDGRHDRSALIGQLVTQVKAGTLVVHDAGRPVMGSVQLEAILGSAVDHCLSDLARKALLHRSSDEGDFHPGGVPASSSSSGHPDRPAEPTSDVGWKDLA